MKSERIKIFTEVALSSLLIIAGFSTSTVKIKADDETQSTQNSEVADDDGTVKEGEFPLAEKYIRKKINKSSSSVSMRVKMAKTAESSTSGTTGVNGQLTWKFEDGTLTISGNGEMTLFNDPDDPNEYIFGFPIDKTKPQWYDFKDQIKNIVINEGVTAIGQFNFYRCAASSVSIPHSVKRISSDAFGNMPNLKNVVIPEGCEILQGSPFNRTPLESLTVPASLKELRMYNFKSYTDGPGKWQGTPDVAPLTMDKIHITGDNPYLSIEDNILYGNHGKTIWYAEPDRTGTYHIKDGVTKLEEGAFYATKLSSVVIPSSVTEIGNMAFRWANNIKEFVIPDSVTKVGTQAIEEMDNLQKLTIGSGVRKIDSSFEANPKLKEVTIKEGIESIDRYAFCDCPSLENILLPKSVTYIGNNAFDSCTSLSNVSFGGKVKEIGESAFEGTSLLTEVSLPDGLTTIGAGAFYRSGLKSVTLPKSVTSIEYNSFPADCNITYADAEQQGSVSPVTDVTYDAQYMETDARSMLDQLNDFRTGNESWYYNRDGSKQTVSNLDKLVLDADLQQMAMKRAVEIAVYLGHQHPDGMSIENALPADAYYYGENIACGQRSAAEVMESWKEKDGDYNGQGHRRNMLSRNFNAVGIGHVRVNNIDYWVQDFCSRDYINRNLPAADDSVHTEKVTITNNLVKKVNVEAGPSAIQLGKAGDTTEIPSVKTTTIVLKDLNNRGYSTYDSSLPVHPVIQSWWTEDPSIAAVQDGKITGIKNGTTNLVAYAFQQKIVVPIQVGPKKTPAPTTAPTAAPASTPTATPAETPEPTAKPTPKPTQNPTPKPAAEKTVTMYRAYNPNSGEHFYTKDKAEFDHIVSLGWNNEGVGWIAPEKSNTPVYRLYNANGGEHHYTTNVNEKNALLAAGWKDEGIGWYSDDEKRTPLYRQYNPNAFANNHNYTTSKSENDYLVFLGWKAEGIGWYGVRAK